MALVGTAWSLVATSAPKDYPVPDIDCYDGVPPSATLLVTLGTPASNDGGVDAGGSPSCGAVDGLAPGVVLVFDVLKGDRPSEFAPVCYGYKTTSLDGVTGVTLSTPASPTDGSFTTASGTFAPTSQQGCTGTWSLDLEPTNSVAMGQLASPLEAGAGSWIVTRMIQIPQAQFCGSAFTTRGPVTCGDAFAVQSITISGDP
jgi:hypothetical protein